MFYLTTHSTHFIYGEMASDIWSDYSDSERGNPLPPHGLLFPINNNIILCATSPIDYYTYHDLCYTSRGALAGTRNSLDWGIHNLHHSSRSTSGVRHIPGWGTANIARRISVSPQYPSSGSSTLDARVVAVPLAITSVR